MRNGLITFIFITLYIVMFSAIAAPADISFQPYPKAACRDYTGTWQGIIADPTNLFAGGGPWAITIHLYEKNGRVIGDSSPIENELEGASKNEKMLPAKKIWATCEDGVLENIIWGEKGECGGVSDEGMLVSKHVIAMKLAWENAMNGTTFRVFLQKIDSKYPKPLPTNKDAFEYGERKSCH